MSKLQLPNVTIWAACWSDDLELMHRTLRVLGYCHELIEAEHWLFFQASPDLMIAPQQWLDVAHIKPLDWQGWSIFVNREAPRYLRSEFAMCVHEDGFPLDVSLWEPAFLEYDYIGAPWQAINCTKFITREQIDRNELIVGNGGFFIWSKRMADAVAKMPSLDSERFTPADVYVCRAMRTYFEDLGMRFAPADLAARFSTEQTHKTCPSFGFHGRRDSSQKYRQGWGQIHMMEQPRDFRELKQLPVED